ncbi:MAG UNVERIFIED_CONTAM: hypothetical protein LVT10_21730 [Anaerolineae bacterium]
MNQTEESMMSIIERGIGWLVFQLPVSRTSLDQLIGEVKTKPGRCGRTHCTGASH